MSPKPRQQPPLPMTADEVAARGWDAVDVVFVTGDAYVDHPSFATALLARLLEDEGFRVAILAQPDWHSADAWRTFGRPRLCFAVSAGNMDSMLNHYTANRKVRNDDAYTPGGKIGRRPDRATLAYCQRSREAYRGVPVIAGGIEASLRRFAHYDYWSDKVRRSILLDSKADLVVYGMGERPLVEIVQRLNAAAMAADADSDRGADPTTGEWFRAAMDDLRAIRGVAYRLGASESPPEDDTITLPSYEEVVADKRAFATMTRVVHQETNPHNARRLVQFHSREAVVANPPSWPLDEAAMDRVYGLPFTRQPHPSYGGEEIPALGIVRNSIQIMRGCFGGCTFCSITAHEGRVIQSRSEDSILGEIQQMASLPGFRGTISDIGGPTANMYRMGCTRPEVQARCRRLSCVHPTICRLLGTDHGPLIRLMKSARKQRGVKQVLVASGIRMDLARRSKSYVRHLVEHHVGGRLKVAPEHAAPEVLHLMKKPPIEEFEAFGQQFRDAAAACGKQRFLEPYFIAGHPGSDLPAMVEVAVYLKRHNYRPQKVQEFIPGPMDIATCMYYTGLDPITGEEVHVPRGRERRLQKALLHYFMPANHIDVREALEKAGRTDLIGPGRGCLIPFRTPKISRKKKSPGKGPAGKNRSKKPSKKRPFQKKRSVGDGPLQSKVSAQKDEKPKEQEQDKAGGGYRPGRKTGGRRKKR